MPGFITTSVGSLAAGWHVANVSVSRDIAQNNPFKAFGTDSQIAFFLDWGKKPNATQGILEGIWGFTTPNPTPVRITDIRDGTSNTLLIGERPPTGDQYLGSWQGYEAEAGIGVAGTEVWANQAGTSWAGPAWGNGPPCPYPAYYGPGSLQDPCSYNHLWSFHTGGSNFALGDGSVRFISYNINYQTLLSLATRAGGEVISDPNY